MKIDRLIGIVMMLINKKKVTAKQLSEHFEVSVRTIQRDLDTLNMAGVPLYADVGVNGGYQLQENFRLEKGFLNREEAGVLYTFLKELEGVTPYSEVSSIYNKFLSLDAHDLDNKKLVVQLNPACNSSDFQTHLSVLSKGRDMQRKVTMTYYDVRFNKTTRVFCPYCLVLINSRWYAFGHCDLRSDFRMFKVSRIARCELSDEKFSLTEMPADLPWESGGDDDWNREEIVLEIDRDNQHILPDYIEPAKCRVVGEKIIVHLHYEINEWLYSQLLGMAPYVKVVQPESLRTGFIEVLKKALCRNNYDTEVS